MTALQSGVSNGMRWYWTWSGTGSKAHPTDSSLSKTAAAMRSTTQTTRYRPTLCVYRQLYRQLMSLC